MKRKSGGKPAFLTREIPEVFGRPSLKACQTGSRLNFKQLRVRKVGLAPQRSCPAGDPALPRSFCQPICKIFRPTIIPSAIYLRRK